MKEAEVSLRIAIYYITNKLTNENVVVSLDGAHIKTKDNIHFDIFEFMEKNCFKKVGCDYSRWQGEYMKDGCKQRIIVLAKSGMGDVNVKLLDGKSLYVESKKGSDKKGNPEYPLMREAIGQLMTSPYFDENTIPAVAVPYYEKTLNLAKKWSQYKQVKMAQIRFILVQEDGDIKFV